MKRDNLTIPLDLGHELIIDNFAGGGGTSTGLEAAFGRPVDIAINHDPEALAMHAINHPLTQHLLQSVWDVNPVRVTRNRPVGLVWLSPDCKHFSKAKGGTPVAKHIRGLAWVGMRWVALTKPRVLMLENVEEFTTWGPLIIDADGFARPDPARRGRTFESFVRQLRAHGYEVDWRELRACDQGAPTIRKRLFLVARRDGLRIEWPEVEFAHPASREVLAGKLAPWRTAAECIDFSLPARSIFDRPKPLAVNTVRRVAKGMWRHVFTSASPFIVGCGGRMGQSPERSVHAPMQTITAKADSCVAQPVLAPLFPVPPATPERPHEFRCASCGTTFPTWQPGDDGIGGACPGCGGEGEVYPLTSTVLTPFLTEHANSSKQRTMAANEPMRTICAQVKGGHFSVVSPELSPLQVPAILTNTTGHPGAKVTDPLPTVTTGNHHAVLAPVIAPLRGTSEGHLSAHDAREPLSTVSAGGTHHALTAAHLVTIGYGERNGQSARAQDIAAPLGTVVTANKHSVVAVHLTHLTHHGERSGTAANEPVPTITCAHRGEQALVAAFLEQANGGFNEGNEGRPCDAPVSTITASGSNQRLITAYLVKYYGNERDGVPVQEPMHTIPTKDRMGLVQLTHVAIGCLAEEHRARARQCAELLHTYLPEQFPEPAELVLMYSRGHWWALVDVTLRMLVPPELYRAQGFPRGYVIHEIPDPDLLFKDGVQVADPLSVPRIPLTATAQVRMCGNSVSPYQAKALAIANFRHEALLRQQGVAA